MAKDYRKRRSDAKGLARKGWSPARIAKKLRTNGGKRKDTKKLSAGTNRNEAIPPATGQVPDQLSWYEMVLAKFPSFDPAWPDDVKARWFEAFDTLLKKGIVGK